MDFRAHALHGLRFSRRMMEGMLAAMTTREDWLFQPAPGTNHALWITGHLGLVDNNILGRFRKERMEKPEGWDPIFGFGSQVSGDSSIYPAEQEVQAYFRQRREALLGVFAELSDEELSAPAPAATERSPIAGAPSVGHIFLFMATHEGMHAGQLSVVRRALGHPPLLS